MPNSKESTVKHSVVNLTGDLYADIENNTFQGAIFKPILRPLSDLDKMVAHPLGKEEPRNFAALLDLTKDEDGEWCERIEADQCENPHVYSVVTGVNWWLFEYHFDVFGLIPARLAISYKEAGL